MRTLTKLAPRIARWILKLQEYDLKIDHRHGSANRNADALSRLPLSSIFVQSDRYKCELLDRQKADPDCRMLMNALEAGTPEDQSDLSPVQHSLLGRIR